MIDQSSQLPEKLKLLFDGLLKKKYIDEHHILMVNNEYSQELKTAKELGVNEERNRTRRAHCVVCRVMIDVDTGEREKDSI